MRRSFPRTPFNKLCNIGGYDRKRSTAKKVTGIVVNDRAGVASRTVRRLRALLHHAGREGLASQDRTGHSNFSAWLQGMIAYISMVNPHQGEKLATAYQRIPEDRPGSEIRV